MFDDKTGIYLPAPHKRRKEVDRIDLCDGVGYIYPTKSDDWPLMASVVRIIVRSKTFVVFESKNSVYAGKPA